jgi:hypothetical protein
MTEYAPYAMPTRVMDTTEIHEWRMRFRRGCKMIPITEASHRIGFDRHTLGLYETARPSACPFAVVRDGVTRWVHEQDVDDYIAANRELVEKRLALRRQGENVRRAYKAIQ